MTTLSETLLLSPHGLYRDFFGKPTLREAFPAFPEVLFYPPGGGDTKRRTLLSWQRDAFRRIRNSSVLHADHWLWSGTKKSARPQMLFTGSYVRPSHLLAGFALGLDSALTGTRTCDERGCINPLHFSWAAPGEAWRQAAITLATVPLHLPDIEALQITSALWLEQMGFPLPERETELARRALLCGASPPDVVSRLTLVHLAQPSMEFLP